MLYRSGWNYGSANSWVQLGAILKVFGKIFPVFEFNVTRVTKRYMIIVYVNVKCYAGVKLIGADSAFVDILRM